MARLRKKASTNARLRELHDLARASLDKAWTKLAESV